MVFEKVNIIRQQFGGTLYSLTPSKHYKSKYNLTSRTPESQCGKQSIDFENSVQIRRIIDIPAIRENSGCLR
jgi:hypothetical protein